MSSTQPRAPLPTSPLLSLQALRAVAALLVVVHHAGYDADTIAARSGSPALGLDRFVDLGFGVHLFFVISGFILLRTAQGFGAVRGALVFALRRALRVVPLYWLLTSLALVGGAVAPSLLNAAPGGVAWVVGSFLFVPVAREGGAINPVLGQGWTLDYEMFFYAIFALSLLLPRRLGLAALTAALVGLVILGKAMAPPFAAAAVWTDGLLLEFVFGLGLGLLAERGLELGASAAAALILGGAACVVALGPLAGWPTALAPEWREGLPAALVVGGCALGPRWRGTRGAVALAAVGDASYSLYLSHPFAVRLSRVAWAALAPPAAPAALFLAAACAVAVAAALLLYRWVERPMTRALSRGLRGEGGRPVLPDAAAAAQRRIATGG